ncbi:hypothetical protein GEV33_000114 [Tenebrio molitor]|uniref:FHOD1 N-terminal GTPase-binding domain-containing protein n=1 Tax=Tenebrio molitor TaxID=7067 RepID=A0A8J6HY61_TENMO|nr:hypothetical protein GEV33_000114 [Tenebrio molitor]
MSLTCRVQYLNDIDPFSYTTNFPDPARPPQHTFSVTLPLINQLAAVHRLLKSPHRRGHLADAAHAAGELTSNPVDPTAPKSVQGEPSEFPDLSASN